MPALKKKQNKYHYSKTAGFSRGVLFNEAGELSGEKL